MTVFSRMGRMGQAGMRVEVRIRALENNSRGITDMVDFAPTQECYFFRGGRSVSLLYSLQQFCTVLYLSGQNSFLWTQTFLSGPFGPHALPLLFPLLSHHFPLLDKSHVPSYNTYTLLFNSLTFPEFDI